MAFPPERGQPERGQPQRFATEQHEAQHWLGILKDGKESEKIEARLGLAVIFERRGMAEEAIELLVSCIGAGHRDPDVYESLGRLYAAQNRPDLSVRARAEAQQLRRQVQREQEATASKVAAARLAPAASAGVQSHSRGLGYLAAGALMTVGGFIFAASFEGGSYLLLYGLPVFGVVVLLRGLTILLSRR